MIKILLLLLVFPFQAYAVEDVCCVFAAVSGASVQTVSWAVSSTECKVGGNYQGKKVCAAVKDPDNMYCSTNATAQDRCAKCGFFWSGKECLTEDPKLAAKNELKEELAKEGKDPSKLNDAAAKVEAKKKSEPTPPPPTLEGDPDDKNLFLRKDKKELNPPQ